ncbi:winged helix-turn-helix domain-containing protein [Vibrio breoganii]|uniref:winged helix-turn-helix domain-containing protein n=1 Tax=Vibrio breoganii TaxID=553239 RepID=UPI000C851611|nr:winged helix-turn-helix domain-containing protein [Vibrio breoganii]PMO32077.1 hypothetical protein BCT12_16350 [Vibrio breoganii]
MKENKVHYKVGDWLFIPYEDKFILDGKDFLIEKRLSNLFNFLCQHPHQIFSRDELINEVWHGMILTDQVITQAIFELRKILKQNGEHPFGYIVTVSKRGYKLDSDVEAIEVCNKPKLKTVTSEEIMEPNDDELEVLAGEGSTTHQMTISQPQANKPVSSQRWKLLILLLIVGLSIAVSYFYVQQKHQLSAVENNQQSADTRSYMSYEPRYIHVVYSQGIENNQLAKGFALYLLCQLKSYKDYRIIFQGDVSKQAANVITLDVADSNGKDYLTVEFDNKITDSKHLSRKYNLDNADLSRSIKVALDDLLDSFDININKNEIAARVAELPENPDALKYALSGFAAAVDIHQNDDVLMNLSRSLQIDPDNEYLHAINYMFNLTNLYLLKEQSMHSEIAKLNEEHEDKLNEFYGKNSTSYRTLEALAMLSLSKDLPLDARKYLQEIPYNQRSIFYYITFAKVCEASGDSLAAEEHYYQAILESSSTDILPVSEVMFFESSLDHIKRKIELSEL